MALQVSSNTPNSEHPAAAALRNPDVRGQHTKRIPHTPVSRTHGRCLELLRKQKSPQNPLGSAQKDLEVVLIFSKNAVLKPPLQGPHSLVPSLVHGATGGQHPRQALSDLVQANSQGPMDYPTLPAVRLPDRAPRQDGPGMSSLV